MSKYGSRNLLFCYLWARFLKIMLYLKLPLSNLSKFKILAKERTEIPEFGTKTSLFWYFLVRLSKKPMFWFLNSEPSSFSDWKILENFWNKAAQICLNVKLCQIQKCQNVGPKTPYLRICQLAFYKTTDTFWIITLQFN